MEDRGINAGMFTDVSLEAVQDKPDDFCREYHHDEIYPTLNDITHADFIQSLGETKNADLALQ